MKNVNRQTATPLRVPRTRRNHQVAVLTSLPAGKCVPIAVMPMLREDALRGSVTVAVEMMETKEILMNPVNLRVTAYCVPFLAMERFEGSRDQFDRSYKGEPRVEGGGVTPFIEGQVMLAHGAHEIYKALGLHAKPGALVNTMYVEAYNRIWNFRAKNRSPDIAPRARTESALAPAFWQHSRFDHVVPDFDQAVIDGEVALNVVEARLPVRGIGAATGSPAMTAGSIRQTDGTTLASAQRMNTNANDVFIDTRGVAPNVFPEIFAEMQENGITVSLSNIELARKTQAFAKLRERYQEHDEEWIIDMLMDGLSIPDQALKQPILLADRTVRFGQAKRYATDAGNLAESAVSGATVANISLRVPKLNTGGVIMVIAECVPEQLFERQRDPFFHSTDIDTWPEYLRDTLDPEKVDIVQNGEIDTSHTVPAATFGYAPMNWKWNAWGPKVGGKFYRPVVDGGTDEARQRLWAVETIDPVLSEDFYLVSSIHTKPFLDTESDPFEATVVGNAVIEGNTVFGGMLVEATSNYDAVAAKAPVERIEKE